MVQLLQLAIDTSTSRPMVALLTGDKCIRKWRGSQDLRHHELLLPGIHECLGDFSLSDLNFLTVGVGPGTFTGIRVGLTTAKFLAAPLSIPCVAVSSLLSLAYQSGHCEKQHVWAISDAKAKRVYALKTEPGLIAPDFSPIDGEDKALSPEEVAEKISPGDFLIGEGASLYETLWPKSIQRPSRPEANSLDPDVMGRIGWTRYQLGLTCSPAQLQPTYLRAGHL